MLLRVYFGSHRAVLHARKVALSGLNGVWLGLLSRDRLHEIDDAYYSGHRDYLDEAPARTGLKRWERAAVDGHFRPGGTIAVMGAGSGREVLALAELGYSVCGFECNPRLVEVGNRLTAGNGAGPLLAPAPRDGWPEFTARYDGIIVGWGAYMHIKGIKRRIEFLRQAHLRLVPGSPILVSFLYRSADSTYFKLSERIGNGLAAVSRVEHVELGDALLPMFVHYFTRTEIERELNDAGFDMVDFELTESPGYALAVGIARDSAPAYG